MLNNRRPAWELAAAVVLVCAFGAPGRSAAQTTLSGWRNIGPRGPVSIDEVHVDPTDEHIYYVLSASGAVYKTTDGGTSWLLLPIWARALSLAPSAPSTVYAAQGSSVARSIDGGLSWTSGGWLPFDYNDVVTSLVVDPQDERVIYVGSSAGFLLSRDGGVTWEQLAREPNRSIALDTNQSPLGAYAIDWRGHLFKWAGGDGFALLGTGFFASQAAVSPTSSTVYFSGSYYDTYPSRSPLILIGAEAGQRWTTSDTGGNIQSIVFQVTGAATFAYLSTDAGLFRGVDTRWGVDGGFVKLASTYPPGVAHVVVRSATARVLLATPTCGEETVCPSLLMSRDHGVTWSAAGAPDRQTDVAFAATAPSSRQTLYAGVYQRGTADTRFYSSRDGGETWQRGALFHGISASVAIDAIDASTVYFVSESPSWTLQRSRDGGASWTPVALPDDCKSFFWTAVTGHPVSSGVVYATCSDWLYRSMDFGDTWTAALSLRSILGVPAEIDSRRFRTNGPFIDAQRPSRVFLAGYWATLDYSSITHFVARSNDGGQTFEVVAGSGAPQWMSVIRFDSPGTSILAMGGTPVYRSDDEGASWVLSSIPPAADLQIELQTSVRYLTAAHSGEILREDSPGAWVPLGFSGRVLPFPRVPGAPPRAISGNIGLWALEARLSIAVYGDGRVTDLSGELSCGGDPGPCSGGYARGTSVTLIATPNVGWAFAGWRGDCTSGTVVVDRSLNCAAVFERTTQVVTLLIGTVSASATNMNATVNPGGLETTAVFEYGTTMLYGQRTPSVAIGAGTAPILLNESLSGLSCSTTYHYRVVADNVAGPVPGSDQVFRTPESPGVASLLLQHQSSGCLVSWHMSGVSLLSQDFLAPECVSDPAWQVVGHADFDADGFSDVVFQHKTSGSIVVWLMNNIVIKEQRALSPSSVSDPNWRIAAVGDFDADGKPDLIIQHIADGRMLAWLLNGTVLKAQVFLNPSMVADPNWRIVGAGDIDLDGKSDLFFQNIASGFMVQWLMDGITIRRQDFLNPSLVPPDWQVSAILDVNSDTRPDMILQNINDGRMVAWPLIGPNLQGQLLLNPFQVSDPRWRIVGPR